MDFLTVQAFDTYQLERMTVPAAVGSDFVAGKPVLRASGRTDAAGCGQ